MVRDEGGVYLFCGQEDFLKKEAEDKIVSTLLGSGSKDLNREIYNARDDCRDIFDGLNTQSLLSDRKIIIIRDVENLPDSKREPFLNYLKNLPKHILLILTSRRIAPEDRFIKAISGYARTSIFNRLNRGRLKHWIYNRLRQEERSITKGALELLMELKGTDDLATLSKELDKLVTYKGHEKTITDEDVIGLVGKSVTRRVFDLAEAIGFKDRDSAMLILRELLSGKKSGMPEIIGLMGWQLRRMWRRKGRFNTEGLKKSLKLLVETDRSIKRGHSKPEFALEQLIVELCGT